MTTLSVKLPNSIQRHLQEMADLEGVPVEQFVANAVSEKISALTAEAYLRTRAERADPVALRAVLDGVPDRAPLPGDE
jgi:predicted transcriptional regulator